MTTVNEQAATGELNGQQPAPAPDGETPPRATAGERAMGVIGIAFALGLLAIGIDLATGGAVTRLIAGIGSGSGDAGAGG